MALSHDTRNLPIWSQLERSVKVRNNNTTINQHENDKTLSNYENLSKWTTVKTRDILRISATSKPLSKHKHNRELNTDQNTRRALTHPWKPPSRMRRCCSAHAISCGATFSCDFRYFRCLRYSASDSLASVYSAGTLQRTSNVCF